MCLLIINVALGYWFIAYSCEVSVMLMTEGMGLSFKRMLHLILLKTNTKKPFDSIKIHKCEKQSSLSKPFLLDSIFIL